MTRKVHTMGIGGALNKDRKQKKAAFKNQMSSLQTAGVSETQAARSVLEQSSLQEFLATAEMANQEFETLRGHAVVVEDGPRLIQSHGVNPEDPVALADMEAKSQAALVPVPRRPQWHEGISPEELTALEGEAFVDWRRGLAEMEEDHGFVMTPYERNVDFWRQLWRCIERSDVLVQICDARDPEFYRSKDLERYVLETPGKQHLLLMNKADFLTPRVRREWAEYFESIGVEVLFFSALRELHRQQKIGVREGLIRPSVEVCASSQQVGGGDKDLRDRPKDGKDAGPRWRPVFGSAEEPEAVLNDDEAERRDEDDDDDDVEVTAAKAKVLDNLDRVEADDVLPPHGQFNDDENVANVAQLLDELRRRLPEAADGKRGTVGFVGYPNVGKSSVINSIFGSKKASMSRTPGKTKHLQTLELPESGITLCDCPGLVFPSVVASRSHLVINGTVPLDELRDFVAPTRLIVGKVGLNSMLDKYDCRAFVQDGIARHGEKSLDPARSFLSAFSVRRKHFLRYGVPDETWSARRIMKDYCSGELLHCERPPGAKKEAASAAAAASSGEPAKGVDPSQVSVAGSGDDFDDVGDFLAEDAAAKLAHPQMTKRKGRHVQKQTHKGAIQEGHVISSSQKGCAAMPGMTL